MRRKTGSLPFFSAVICLFAIFATGAQAQEPSSPVLTRNSFKEAIRRASPSVVSIEVRFAQSFSPVSPVNSPGAGSGSGVIVDREGYIITNKHVVSGNVLSVEVALASGEKFSAVIKTVASDTDIAVLKAEIPAEKLTPAAFRDSDTLEVGEIVIAIGSPFGFKNTATQGIVSAVRVIPGVVQQGLPSHKIVQTDAAINPGNSGGPLIDLDGKVVGINSFIFSTGGGSVGLGFAIPSNVAKTIYEQAIAGTRALGSIGATTQDLDDNVRRIFGIPRGIECVLVSSVSAGGPAATAGLRQGDCIESVDGKPQKDATAFEWLVRNTAPGTSLLLSVRRRDKSIVVNVKVAKKESP